MKILGLGPADSVAISGDGERWALLGVPEALADVLRVHAELRPSAAQPRPIAAVVLGEARLAPLLSLATLGPVDVHTTPAIFEALTAAPLAEACACSPEWRWHLLPLGGDRRRVEFQIVGLPHLHFTALAVDEDDTDPVGGRFALEVEDRRDGRRLLHAPHLVAAASALSEP